ncbi:alkaline phosphatase synthesis sensor protein PhoR [Pseudosulfitobacter pseudonitzschiae]|uniref:histidine kinase n=2 Tax=Rhodobacterales TaxID=204455 RepID=A0A221K045_9RHOB|nr:alkaline phosphatase synthesis sensor protein PhoR [Pseudosulfitobacter pseudonitzschiae]
MPGLVVNQSEVIVGANIAARNLIGQRIEGRPYVTMLRQPALLDAVEACLRQGKPRTAPYLTNDGAQHSTFSVHVAQVVTDDAAPMVLLTFEDVTHVQQAGQMRRDFVANVSHELRTPLTALMGFIETLRGPARNDPAAQARFLGIMQDQAERMNRLVGDLLSLSRVEGDERVRPTGQVNLRECLASVVALMTPLADEAGVTLVAELGDNPVTVAADRDQLVQVVSNLIENAIKYGGKDRAVTLRLNVNTNLRALRGPGATIEVIDQGHGIDPIHLPRLTERFYRADNHRSRELGGTGLGLAIVKHIVSRHRGRLRIDSVLGQGTTVQVALPWTPPDES